MFPEINEILKFLLIYHQHF